MTYSGLMQKVHPGSLEGKRICRPYCRCCGGVSGVRAAFRKPDNSKPKTKRIWQCK